MLCWHTVRPPPQASPLHRRTSISARHRALLSMAASFECTVGYERKRTRVNPTVRTRYVNCSPLSCRYVRHPDLMGLLTLASAPQRAYTGYYGLRVGARARHAMAPRAPPLLAACAAREIFFGGSKVCVRPESMLRGECSFFWIRTPLERAVWRRTVPSSICNVAMYMQPIW